MKKEYLECGRILAPHGVRGLMKVEVWCDSPEVLIAQKRVFLAEGEAKREMRIESCVRQAQHLLMSLSGICDRETVQAMKNTVLYLKREDIPLAKGAYFLQDIIGLDAYDFDTGRRLGTVTDITDAVRGRLFVIDTGEKTALVPDVGEFIKEIDEERGVFIRVIPGLID
ncbi:MAG: 16S rRNA processing protein RimM [Clostridia bacterium]|nr:16S rRNA processing protein RimM [Clostridia bacterium]MBQ2737639.1 16S rRNA processing protein RimM [Clostridia bacterium]